MMKQSFCNDVKTVGQGLKALAVILFGYLMKFTEYQLTLFLGAYFTNGNDGFSGLVSPTRKMTQPLFTSSNYGFYWHLL